MAERKRNRNALFLLVHKLYASDYDSDSVASENHCENRPLQAPLFRLSPARPRFSRNFSRCAFLSCSLELVKGTVSRRDWETPTSTNPSFHENRNRFWGARVQVAWLWRHFRTLFRWKQKKETTGKFATFSCPLWYCTPSEMKFLVFGSSKQGKEKSILKFFALSYHDTV